jgi:hypothetical protein
LGIKNVRCRGVIRILIGLLITAGGFIYGVGVSYINFFLEEFLYLLYAFCGLFFNFFLLYFVGLAIPIISSAWIGWGLVEMLTNKPWDKAHRAVKGVVLIFVGIPISITIMFYYFEVVAAIEEWIRPLFK